MASLSNREKMLGGGLAALAVLYLARGNFERVVTHVDDAHAHPVGKVAELDKEMGRVGKAVEKMTDLMEKQEADRIQRETRAQMELEKKQAEQREFWIKSRADQDRRLEDILRQMAPLAVPPATRQRPGAE